MYVHVKLVQEAKTITTLCRRLFHELQTYEARAYIPSRRDEQQGSTAGRAEESEAFCERVTRQTTSKLASGHNTKRKAALVRH